MRISNSLSQISAAQGRKGVNRLSPLNQTAPGLSGTPHIGQTLTAIPGVWDQADAVVGQWLRGGVLIPGATGPDYLLAPEDDLIQISYLETATNAAGQAAAASPSVLALYEAPTAQGGLFDEIFDQNTGTQLIDATVYFTGSGLTFSVVGTGTTIDPATGILSVDTTDPVNGETITILAANSGGDAEQQFLLTVEDEETSDQVLTFTGSNGLTQPFPGFDFDGAGSTGLDEEGLWFAAYIFFEGGTYENDPILSFTATSAATKQIIIRAGDVYARNDTARVTPALTPPTAPGWYLCTGRIKQAGANKADLTFWRNAEMSGPQNEFVGSNLSAFDTVSLGFYDNAVSSSYLGVPACGFAWGYGDPAALHVWAYNAGAFRDLLEYDFADDAGATLEGYWAGNRVDDASAFSPADVVDAIGMLDAWTPVGALTWADRAPPWAPGGIVTIQSVTIEDAARNQAVIVAASSDGSSLFSGPTIAFTEDDFDLWTERGFGPIRVQSASSVVTGNQVTITLTLNRDIHASESISYQTTASWFDDGANSGGVENGAAINNSALADPATSTGLSFGKIAVEFDAAYQVGFYEDNLGFIVDGGSGVQIIDTYPRASTAEDERLTTGALHDVHGAEKNPRYETYQHGYDGRNRHDNFTKYDDARNVAKTLPLSLSEHDSFIKVRSNIRNSSENGGDSSHPVFLKEVWGLHVASSAPAANAFCPPLVGYDGTSARPTMTLDVAATAAALPSYSTSGHDRPPIAEVAARLTRFNPIACQIRSVEDRRHMTPSFITQADGYGLKMAETMNAAALCLLGDDTSAEKEDVVRGLAQHGWQWWNCFDAESVVMTPDGGHAQYHQFPSILALHWSGASAATIASVADNLRGNLFGQTFKIDATILSDVMDPHGTAGETLPKSPNDNKPYATHRKEITAISGNVITVGNAQSVEIGTGATNPKTYVLNMRLRQESDSNTSRITAVNQSAKQYTVSNGSGFTVGEDVYIIPTEDAVIGGFDWSLGGHPYNGVALGPSTSYRNLNGWTGQMLAIKALGLMHANFKAFEGYVVRANAADDPVGFDYPEHHTTFYRGDHEDGAQRFFRWDVDFWNAHWAAISGLPSVI